MATKNGQLFQTILDFLGRSLFLGLTLLALSVLQPAYAGGGGAITYYALSKCDPSVPSQGTITNSPAGSTFVSGTWVTLTANAAVGYEFDHWTGDVPSGNIYNYQTSIQMTSNKSVCAVFKLKKRLDMCSPEPGLEVFVNGQPFDGGTLYFSEGQTVELNAVVDPQYQFLWWEGVGYYYGILNGGVSWNLSQFLYEEQWSYYGTPFWQWGPTNRVYHVWNEDASTTITMNGNLELCPRILRKAELRVNATDNLPIEVDGVERDTPWTGYYGPEFTRPQDTPWKWDWPRAYVEAAPVQNVEGTTWTFRNFAIKRDGSWFFRYSNRFAARMEENWLIGAQYNKKYDVTIDGPASLKGNVELVLNGVSVASYSSSESQDHVLNLGGGDLEFRVDVSGIVDGSNVPLETGYDIIATVNGQVKVGAGAVLSIPVWLERPTTISYSLGVSPTGYIETPSVFCDGDWDAEVWSVPSLTRKDCVPGENEISVTGDGQILVDGTLLESGDGSGTMDPWTLKAHINQDVTLEAVPGLRSRFAGWRVFRHRCEWNSSVPVVDPENYVRQTDNPLILPSSCFAEAEALFVPIFPLNLRVIGAGRVDYEATDANAHSEDGFLVEADGLKSFSFRELDGTCEVDLRVEQLEDAVFVEWLSDDSEFNHSKEPTLTVDLNRERTLTAVFATCGNNTQSIPPGFLVGDEPGLPLGWTLVDDDPNPELSLPRELTLDAESGNLVNSPGGGDFGEIRQKQLYGNNELSCSFLFEPSSVEGDYVSVLTRGTDLSNYVEVRIAVDEVQILERVDGTESVLGSHDLDISVGKWYDLFVRSIDADIQVWVKEKGQYGPIRGYVEKAPPSLINATPAVLATTEFVACRMKNIASTNDIPLTSLRLDDFEVYVDSCVGLQGVRVGYLAFPRAMYAGIEITGEGNLFQFVELGEGNELLRALRERLVSEGVELVELTELTEVTLGQIDVFLYLLPSVKESCTPAFDSSELAAVRDFVENGGGIVSISDNSCQFALQSNFLTSEFGILSLPVGMSEGSDRMLIESIVEPEHPVMSGPYGVVERLKGDNAGAIDICSLPEGAQVLALNKNCEGVLVAMEGGQGLPAGSGAFVAMPDINLVDSENLYQESNAIAILNALAYAAKGGGAAPNTLQDIPCASDCAEREYEECIQRVVVGYDSENEEIYEPCPVGGEGEGEGEGEGDYCGENLLGDPGFEAGLMSESWSYTGGFEPRCTDRLCGPGAKPFRGAWMLWMGGRVGDYSYSVNQPVVVPEEMGSVTLQFYVWITASSGNRRDKLEVFVDGHSVSTIHERDERFHDGYRLVSINLPEELSDGLEHTVEFRTTTYLLGSLTHSNFFVDNVSLIAGCDTEQTLQIDSVSPDVAGKNGDAIVSLIGDFDIEYEPDSLEVFFTNRQGGLNVARDVPATLISTTESDLVIEVPQWAGMDGQYLVYATALQGETRVYSNPLPFWFTTGDDDPVEAGEGEGEGEPEAECGVNQLRNPGFNEGPPFDHWAVTGDPYMPVFDERVVPSGVVAYYGGWGALLGGRREALNMTLTQAEVTIPEGEYPILQFYLWIQDRSQNGVDKLEVLVDGNVVKTILESDANYRNQYGLVTILLDGALADGENDHSIALRVVTSASNGAVTNFLVDELSLVSSCNAPGTDPLVLTNVAPDVASNAGGDTVIFNGDFDAEIDPGSIQAFFSTDPGIPDAVLDTEGVILQKSATELSVWVPDRAYTGQYLAYVSALQDSERIYSNPVPFRFDDFASAEQARCEVEVIRDGSFEGGYNNPYWDADYDLLRPQSTGGNMLPRSGEWGLWFGGWPDITTASMSQTIRIPEGESATLSVWAHYIDARTDDESTSADNDYLKVFIDEVEVAVLTIADEAFEFDPLNGMLFAEESVEITDAGLLDGELHTLRIEGHVEGTQENGYTHFRMDDISLVVDCEYERDDDEELEPTLRIASVSPVSASLDGTETIQITKADESDALTGLTSLQVHFIRSGASSPRPSADDAVAAVNVTTDTLEAMAPDRDAADLTYVYVTGISGGTKYISNVLPFRFEANEPCPESLLLDGGLELGTGTPYWRETSTHGNRIIQEVTEKSHPSWSGDWFAQFGGTSDTDRIEHATMEQTIVIPDVTHAQLGFGLSIPKRSGNSDDRLRIYVDGSYLGQVRQDVSYFHNGYKYIEWKLDASYVDGEEHTILIEVEQDGRSQDNSERTVFLVDEICLVTDNSPDPITLRIDAAVPNTAVRTIARNIALHGTYNLSGSTVESVDAYLAANPNVLEPSSDVAVTLTGYDAVENTLINPTTTTPTNLGAGLRYAYLVATFADESTVKSNPVPVAFVDPAGTYPAPKIDINYAIPSVLDRSIPNDVNLFGEISVPADYVSVDFYLDDGDPMTADIPLELKAFESDEVRVEVPADLDTGEYPLYSVLTLADTSTETFPSDVTLSLIDLVDAPLDCEENLLMDGSFESGALRGLWDPNPNWEATYDNYVLICSNQCSPDTESAPLANTGDYFAWIADDANVTQSVVIPQSASATLNFYLWVPFSRNDPNVGSMTVFVDDTPVFVAFENRARNLENHDKDFFLDYELMSVDLCDFADGESHTVTFAGQEGTAPFDSGFLVDDICLTTSESECEDETDEGQAVVTVVPSSLEFGYVSSGSFKDAVLVLTNAGYENLRGTVGVAPPFRLRYPGQAFYDIAPGKSLSVPIRFQPMNSGSFDRAVVFTGGGGVRIPVRGQSHEPVTVATVVAIDEQNGLTVPYTGAPVVGRHYRSLPNVGIILNAGTTDPIGFTFQRWEDEFGWSSASQPDPRVANYLLLRDTRLKAIYESAATLTCGTLLPAINLADEFVGGSIGNSLPAWNTPSGSGPINYIVDYEGAAYITPSTTAISAMERYLPFADSEITFSFSFDSRAGGQYIAVSPRYGSALDRATLKILPESLIIENPGGSGNSTQQNYVAMKTWYEAHVKTAGGAMWVWVRGLGDITPWSEYTAENPPTVITDNNPLNAMGGSANLFRIEMKGVTRLTSLIVTVWPCNGDASELPNEVSLTLTPSVLDFGLVDVVE